MTDSAVTHRASTAFGRLLLAVVLTVLGSLSQAATLTVVGGNGSGSYAAGSTAYITANPTDAVDEQAPSKEPTDARLPDRIFDRWTGQTELLADPFSPRTSLVMPASDLTVTAQFKDAPRWNIPTTLTYFPPAHQRIIYLLHGLGGCATCMTGAHPRFIKDANARGYAVVVPESYDRDGKLWSLEPDPNNNVDMQRLVAIHNDLIARGVASSTAPVHLVGTSGGGFFASLFNHQIQQLLGFPVESMALVVSPGSTPAINVLEVPALFAIAENDTLMSPDLIVTSFSNLIARGVPSQLVVGEPGPLTPSALWAGSGISGTEAQLIHAELARAGFLDATGFLTSNPRTSGWQAVVTPLLSDSGDVLQVGETLLQVYAEHAFLDVFSHRVLAFLENPVTRVDVLPRIDSFSPSSAAPGVTVTIQGRFFVAVEAVTIGGAPAQFVQAGSTSLLAVVPEGAGVGPVTVTNVAGTAVSEQIFGAVGPSITALSVTEGPPGTAVEITGTGLVGVQSVTFGGVAAPFTEIVQSYLVTVVPAAGRDGPLLVTTSAGTADGGHFDVFEPAVVTGMTPKLVWPGDTVTITGQQLQDVSAVLLRDTIAANFTILSDSELQFVVPAGLGGSASVSVVNPGGRTIAGPLLIRR